MLFDQDADDPQENEGAMFDCQGTWRERLTFDITSTDTLLRCDGCGEWMFFHRDGTMTRIATIETTSQT